MGAQGGFERVGCSSCSGDKIDRGHPDRIGEPGCLTQATSRSLEGKGEPVSEEIGQCSVHRWEPCWQWAPSAGAGRCRKGHPTSSLLTTPVLACRPWPPHLFLRHLWGHSPRIWGSLILTPRDQVTSFLLWMRQD